jgi:hypothetical protein
MRFGKIFLIIYTCFAVCGEAKIMETAHFTDVAFYLDKDCWFLVDLDNTLYEGKQALGHANWFYDELQQRFDKGKTKEEAFKEFYPKWVKIQEICPVKPVEDSTIPLLLALQQKGIVIMGFTHRQPPVIEATLRQVSSLGLDFSKTAPHVTFDSVPASGGPTCYRQGIFFAGDYNRKGEVLISFLTLSGQRPKKIVFIDDKYKNIEELEKVLENQKIEYLGVYYTALEHQPQIYSRELAQFQLRFVDAILSNEAAKCLMEHQQE